MTTKTKLQTTRQQQQYEYRVWVDGRAMVIFTLRIFVRMRRESVRSTMMYETKKNGSLGCRNSHKELRWTTFNNGRKTTSAQTERRCLNEWTRTRDDVDVDPREKASRALYRSLNVGIHICVQYNLKILIRYKYSMHLVITLSIKRLLLWTGIRFIHKATQYTQLSQFSFTTLSELSLHIITHMYVYIRIQVYTKPHVMWWCVVCSRAIREAPLNEPRGTLPANLHRGNRLSIVVRRCCMCDVLRCASNEN